MEFRMEDESTWRLVKQDEFQEEKLDQYYYMTYTSNHSRAAIVQAIKQDPKLAEFYERVSCQIVFCENPEQANLLGRDDNETADMHLSTSWWDRCQKFRRMWVKEPPTGPVDKWREKVLKLCGIPPNKDKMKSHRDIFLLAAVEDRVWTKLEELQNWFALLPDTSVVKRK
jgi:hypothetical protein